MLIYHISQILPTSNTDIHFTAITLLVFYQTSLLFLFTYPIWKSSREDEEMSETMRVIMGYIKKCRLLTMISAGTGIRYRPVCEERKGRKGRRGKDGEEAKDSLLLLWRSVLSSLSFPRSPFLPFLAVLTSPSLPRRPYLAVFSLLSFPNYPFLPILAVRIPRRPFLAVLSFL